jgi:hypothetical protein
VGERPGKPHVLSYMTGRTKRNPFLWLISQLAVLLTTWNSFLEYAVIEVAQARRIGQGPVIIFLPVVCHANQWTGYLFVPTSAVRGKENLKGVVDLRP